MLAEQCNGTSLTPFLDEYHRHPRFLSIVDICDDLLESELIATSELMFFAKQEIIIKKSSLLKHFERISFFHKRDADLLAEVTLIANEDHLLEQLTERATAIKQAYIKCIVNTIEHEEFIQRKLSPLTGRLSSLSIHGPSCALLERDRGNYRVVLEFIRHFHLHPICGKIFYWLNLTDETIVQTLIATKTFVNEYTLDGIYESFVTRLNDTIGSNPPSAQHNELHLRRVRHLLPLCGTV